MAKEEKEKVVETTEEVKTTIVNDEVTTADKIADEKEAIETAKEIKKGRNVTIKIPVDPQNPEDKVVPVSINGYAYYINRGETVEVPEAVAKILEEAKYI